MKKSIQLTVLISTLLIANGLFAQNKDDFYKHPIDVHYIYTSPGLTADNSSGYSSLGFGITSVSSKDWGFSYEFSSPLFSDAIFAIYALVANVKSDYPSFATTLLGAHNFGINVYNANKITAVAGLNVSSYMVKQHSNQKNSSGVDESGEGKPMGVGSYLRFDYFINDFLMARVRNSIAFPFFVGDNRLIGSANIMQTDLELSTKQGFYIATEFFNLVGQDPSVDSHLRTNFKAGIRLKYR